LSHLLFVTTAADRPRGLVFDVGTKTNLTAKQITSRSESSNARIRGVVEANFFDWVTDTPAGKAFVWKSGSSVARFDWGAVEHDVLRVLYESVITKDVRERMGEYYTPDWLADQVVESAVPDPMATVCADSACEILTSHETSALAE